MYEENDERKEIEVVKGDGTGIDISPAYKHLNDTKPEKRPTNIVIPKEMNDEKDSDEEN